MGPDGDLDFDVLAVRLCFAFSWTLEYVLDLPYPAFMRLSRLLPELRAEEAVQTVFAGYTAGKFGGKLLDSLFDRQCSLTKNPVKAEFSFTQKEYEIALAAAKLAAERTSGQITKDKENV